MAVWNLYSKRQKQLRGEYPDVYVYDELPMPLRVQVVHIIRDAVGKDNYNYYNSNQASEFYKAIYHVLCRERGILHLSEEYNDSIETAVFNFFLKEKSVEKAIDVLELSFKFIDTYIRNKYPNPQFTGAKISPDEAISDLNTRFKEHGVGYQFESSEIIRVDSEFIHSEVVKPTLLILRGEQYAGANEEFLNAHEHYRHGKYKECLNDCLKAFESTMRVICNRRGWVVSEKATASKLIATCADNGLLQSFLDSQMVSVKTLLESGVPTVRNKLGGHGQGETPVVVPEHLARYALHLTATTILLLAEADANKN